MKDYLERERAAKVRWPDPWISLNPAFASGGTVDELVGTGLLHPDCGRFFRVKRDSGDPGGRSLTLYRHQREAIEAARDGSSYVLTTGTGSGKSLSYIVPVVDSVLRDPRPNRISAIVVYPMNALANSQLHELKKYLEWGIPVDGRSVTFDRYTGQDLAESRQRILDRRPDILLTNYVMLEYILTRPPSQPSARTRHGATSRRPARPLVAASPDLCVRSQRRSDFTRYRRVLWAAGISREASQVGIAIDIQSGLLVAEDALGLLFFLLAHPLLDGLPFIWVEGLESVHPLIELL
ncbi:DEAD/DEAH box helicase [Frankia casuarinae]|uniref:DEAD/DEAH box helicase n=1 Tax=Frankia casuarinae (strain DSM 45818 / CECT 9043 / HFP020203 / CcI3) TaxID=106370 RepID=UPI0028C3B955|nr:DEAD/DEAH box helicase [Frankia casuarinae]